MQPQPAFVDNEVKRIFSCSLIDLTSSNSITFLEQKCTYSWMFSMEKYIKYFPEPSVWNVKLIPHVSYRPWILENRTPDTKIFFYPLKEAYLLELGVPSNELIRGHKALGDELRLKLLYQL